LSQAPPAFIGSNLVHELVAQGHSVKALVRPRSNLSGLDGTKAELVTGDVLDRRLLEREIDGCDWCFHTAAIYQLWMPDYAPMYEVNVEGTRNVLESAGKVGCIRTVIPAPSAASVCRKKWTEKSSRPTKGKKFPTRT
jgi:dihydroflavonol-4-reductase